ncbi:MAG: phosphotransferase [Elusimicrobia bacterium]|nr:phosphotransferase [Elusimicrobiota bacterium]
MPSKKPDSDTAVLAQSLEQNLKNLFKKTFGEEAKDFIPLKGDASARKLFRMRSSKRSVIGAFGPDKPENAAFLEFSRHFRKEGMPVPEIYAEEQAKNIYLEEDLGDLTLFDFLANARTDCGFPQEVLEAYKKTIEFLPRFQMSAGKTLNYKLCYPRADFDRQSIIWDLNYFKYYFLRLGKIPFNEQKLEDDFNKFADFLLEADREYFLYRDFQSRNVMLKEGSPYFIDYQGGRRGALQYDVASLLYDAKADIPAKTKIELLKHYMDAADSIVRIDRNKFMRHYYGYIYIRMMQAMGTYGLRGFYEGKTHFLQSVPYAVKNIENLLRNAELPVKLPELMTVFKRIAASSILRQIGNVKLGLTVRVISFSYRNGIPQDEKGHGGGYVFDCRALPNPGKFEKYAAMTGKSPEVVEFFAKEPGILKFTENVYNLVDSAVENYLGRNFTDLMVSFGCTGGLHRSAYCAELLVGHLKEKYKINIEITHRELINKTG